MATTIADLLVRITGDSKGLQKEIAASQRQIKRAFGSEALAASRGAITVLAGLGAAVAAAGAMAGKSALGWNLAVNEIEDVSGMAGEAASQLLATAGLVGLSGEDASAALVKMSKNAQTAFDSIIENGKDSTDVFTKFGIAIVDENNKLLSSEQIFANVAAKHRELANGVEKTAMEVEIFGKKGAKLNDWLNLTEGQMSELTARAERMGLIVKSDTTQAWENATFEVNRAKLGFTAAGNAILSDLLPAATSGSSAVADLLESFAVDTKMSGIRVALVNLIPDSLQPAIMAVAAALTGYAVPALVLAGYHATLALGPLGWFAAALGTIAYAAVSTGNALAKMGDQADDAVARLNGFNPVGLDQVGVSASNARKEMALLFDEYAHMNGSQTKTTAPAGVMPEGTGTKGAKKAWDDLEREAKQASKEIYKEWLQMTNSQSEQLNAWYNDELDKLNKSAAANENYDRDLTRLNEIYAEKRRKIAADEAAYKTGVYREARDRISEFANIKGSIGLEGVKLDQSNLDKEYKDKITKIEDYWADMTVEFANGTKQQKDDAIQKWTEAGVAFKINEQGMVDFSEQKNKDLLVAKQKYAEDSANLYKNYADIVKTLQVEYNNADVKGYIETLNTKRAQDYAFFQEKQTYLQAYQEAWYAVNKTSLGYAVDFANGMASSVQECISSAFAGTKSIGQAWKDLGQSIRKVIADVVADWIAAQVKMMAMNFIASIFGFSTGGQASSGIAATNSSIQDSIVPASATGGLQRGPGTGTSDSILAWLSNGEYVIRAAMVDKLGVRFLDALNAGRTPAFAGGGIVTGPSRASLASRIDAPLKRMIEKAGRGSGGSAVINQYNYGDYNYKTDVDETNAALGDMVLSALRG